MKLCAIVCEYNPFHNGHAYQIKKSLEESGCDAAICIMNGNFSQRGEPTIVDKITRAKMAIAGGASAVVQIPTYFASTNAEVFALTAVKIAASFDDVTHISFGSECGDIQSIKELANFLYTEPKFYSDKVKRNLKDGFSLGSAKVKALSACINEKLVCFKNPEVVMELLTKPNNILAVEYVRALLKIKNKKITPITIKRKNPFNAFDTAEVDFALSDASSLRKSLAKSKSVSKIKKYIPANSYYILSEYLKENKLPNKEIWELLTLFKFRTTPAGELQLNYDMVEGIENRLILAARESVEYDQFLESAISRRYSHNRIQRIVISTLLNLQANVVKNIYEIPYLPYVKVLACKDDSKLLASLHNSSNTVVITRKSDVIKAQKDPFAKTLMFAEDRANSLYQMLLGINKMKHAKLAAVSDIFVKTEFID